MPLSLMIIDDFLEKPDAFRQTALGLNYPDLKGEFPGRNSAQRIDLPGLSQHVSSLVGENLRPIDPMESHGHCRLTLASDPRLGAVHVDSAQWSGILYLSRDQDARGGTDFFRHKKTGLDQIPINDREAGRLGYASSKAVMDQTVFADGKKRSAWEKTMSIPLRFNRLILLRPWLFHSSGPGFGSSVADGRLIYVMFFTLNR